MLDKFRVLVRDRGEEGLSALPDPGAGVLCGHRQSLRVTAPHTVVCQADRRTGGGGGGGGWDRSDWNVVKEVLFVYWLIPTLAPPTRGRFLDVTSWLRLKNFVVPELGQILLSYVTEPSYLKMRKLSRHVCLCVHDVTVTLFHFILQFRSRFNHSVFDD